MGFFSDVFYFFAPYTGAVERAVGRFFKGLTEHGSQQQTRTRLGRLVQHDIAAINLWTEYRYKGYRYLDKRTRRQLYANLRLITDDFGRFYADHKRPTETVLSRIRELAPHATIDADRAVLLQAIMEYLSPERGVYEYRESSSFGRLLRDPSREKLVGDCNQIVTLYIYLYSRFGDIRGLQVRALPGHVALHAGGIDIEATNGTFANYGSKGTAPLPVEEIVSINLLDISDSYLATHEVAAEDLLQASRLAFILSHERNIVTRNLRAAYGGLVNALMKRHNFTRALALAQASRDPALLGIVGHNGAVYEIEHDNYAAARRFARHAPGRDELIRSSWLAEGAYRYRARRYHDAIRAFGHAGDQTLVRKCYEALFFEEQGRLGPGITTGSIKQHAGTVKRMHLYANRSGNRKLAAYADGLQKHL